MAIRDLGYRPYEGKRLPPSHNMTVMLRHGLRRAWGSWLVKIAVFVGWAPPLIAAAFVGFMSWVTRQMGGDGGTTVLDSAEVLWWLLQAQTILVLMITLGAGAAAIAEDLTHRAFQFYLAKPVTRLQYLVGRISAVAIYGFAFTFLPVLFVEISIVAFAPPEQQLERLGLILPGLLYSVVISVVLALTSVGISSLSKSRALTMTAWLVVFIVPYVIAGIVSLIGDWPWLYLGSLPKLLGFVGGELFKIEPSTAVRWYHAAPVLAALAVGGGWLAHWRLGRAEVIT